MPANPDRFSSYEAENEKPLASAENRSTLSATRETPYASPLTAERLLLAVALSPSTDSVELRFLTQRINRTCTEKTFRGYFKYIFRSLLDGYREHEHVNAVAIWNAVCRSRATEDECEEAASTLTDIVNNPSTVPFSEALVDSMLMELLNERRHTLADGIWYGRDLEMVADEYDALTAGFNLIVHGETETYVGDDLLATIDNDDSVVPCGFAPLDAVMGGFMRGTLSLVAARPSDGKTAMMVQMASRIAERGTRVHFVSLETPATFLLRGAICAEHEMSNVWLKWTPEEKALFKTLVEEWRPRPLTFDDRSYSLDAVVGSITRAVEHGAEIVFLDYMQIVDTGDDNETAKISRVAGDIARLAGTLRIPIVAGCQVNRQYAGEPSFSGLKGSGALEEDSYCVWWQNTLLSEPGAEITAEWHCLKLKGGQRGAVRNLKFTKRWAQWAGPAVNDPLSVDF